MSYFSGVTFSKSESPDTTPYTTYYPHNRAISERNWTQDYVQVISIDPAKKNYSLRIERRYASGKIIPIVFDKAVVLEIKTVNNVTICMTYHNTTKFLNKYIQFYKDCHFIIIERQLPKNYVATRIAQHTITYFSTLLCDTPLLPAIVEVDSKLKGKELGAPKYCDLKRWAIEKARELLTTRGDEFSIRVMNGSATKQDDFADTVCQVEALFKCWGLKLTCSVSEIREVVVTKPLILNIHQPVLNLQDDTQLQPLTLNVKQKSSAINVLNFTNTLKEAPSRLTLNIR